MNNRLVNNLILVLGLICLLIAILFLGSIYNTFLNNPSIEKFSLNPEILKNNPLDNLESEINIINCQKYPFLCSEQKSNNYFYPYSYRNAGPLKRLDLISPRYRHSSPYKKQENTKKRWIRK